MADRYQYLSETARLTLSRVAEWTTKAKSHLYRALDQVVLDVRTWVDDNFLRDVAEDTTPQLGGDLDVDGNKIVSTSNGDIDLEPDGTGNVLIGNFEFDADQSVGAGQDDYVLTYDDGTGLISLEAASGVAGMNYLVDDTSPQLGGDLDVNGSDIVSTSNADISILPNGTGNVILGTLTFDGDQTVGAGQDNYVLTYDDGAGTIQLEAATGGMSDVVDDTSPQLGGDLDINGNSIVSTSNGDIAITPNGSGDLVLDGLNWPQSDGSTDQVLKTDGAGQLSWTANSGSGIANVVDDTTPQLGGDLDVNGNSIVSVSNGDIDITPDGTGDVSLGNFTFDADQSVGAGQDNYVLTYDDGTGKISLEAGGGGVSDFTDLGDTPANYSGAADDWVKVNSGATALEFTSSPVTSISVSLPLTKSGSSSVSLDINNATTSLDGAMSSTDKTKLDGIESGADVTDSSNVASAGAIMDSDFSSNGVMIRTGSGSHTSRTITAGDGISVSNGNGVSGNPTISADVESVSGGNEITVSGSGALTVAFDRDITVSTSAPSGGSNGDIWFRYV